MRFGLFTVLYFIIGHAFSQGPELAFQLGHNSNVICLTSDEQMNYIFSGSDDGNILVWEVKSGKQLRVFSNMGEIPTDMIFDEKKSLLIVLFHNELKAWRISDGALLYKCEFSADNQMKKLLAGPGFLIAAGDLELYRITSEFKTQLVYNYIEHVKDTSKFYKTFKIINESVEAQKNSVLVMTNRKDSTSERSPSLLRGLGLSDDGKFIKVHLSFQKFGKSDGIYMISADSLIRKGFVLFFDKGNSEFSPKGDYFYYFNSVRTAIFKRRSDCVICKPNLVYMTSAGRIQLNVFTVNENIICYGDIIGGVIVSKTGSNRRDFILNGHSSKVTSLYLSKDGDKLISADENGLILLWNLNTGKLLKPFQGIAKPITALRYNLKGDILYIGYNDGEIKVWNILENSFKRLLLTNPLNPFRTWKIIDFKTSDYDSIVSFRCIAEEGDNYFIYDAIWNSSNNNLLLDEKLFNTGKPEFKEKHTLVTDEKDSILSIGTKIFDYFNGASNAAIESGHIGLINALAWNRRYGFYTTAGADGLLKSWRPGKKNELFTSGCLSARGFFYVLPEGYYYVDKNSLKHLSFRMGDRIYPFEQFDLTFNRPDIVVQKFPFADSTLVLNYSKAYEKRKKRSQMFAGNSLLNDDLPKIEILNGNNLNDKDGKCKIKVRATGINSNISAIYTEVNGVLEPIRATNKLKLIEDEIVVELSEGINKITIYSQNENGRISLKEELNIKNTKRIKPPTLFLIAIGSGEFNDSALNLMYAAKDANDIYNYFKNKKQFEKIISKCYTGKNVTRNILPEINSMLASASSNDFVVLFYAGHGLLDHKFDYYLSTGETNFNKPEEKSFLYSELENSISACIARKKLLLIDACHGGEIDKESAVRMKDGVKVTYGDVKFRGEETLIENNKAFELSKTLFADVDRSVGAAVISSSGGVELAAEGKKWNNGVFTYALLKGLKSKKADLNGDRNVTVSELLFYVNENVKILTSGRQTPTSRVENINYDFKVQ